MDRSDSERPEAAWHPDLKGYHNLAVLDHILLLLVGTVMSSESYVFQ